MGRKHSELLQILFPNQVGTGIDLGNIELKECSNIDECITIKNKDMIADYIVMYNHLRSQALIVEINDIPYVKTVANFRWNKLIKVGKIVNDEIELIELTNNLIKEDIYKTDLGC